MRPSISFAHFGFDEQLMGAIRKLEYTQPTPIQCQVLNPHCQTCMLPTSLQCCKSSALTSRIRIVVLAVSLCYSNCVKLNVYSTVCTCRTYIKPTFCKRVRVCRVQKDKQKSLHCMRFFKREINL